MFTIKIIVRSTGKPACDKKVCVGFDGLFMGLSQDKYTDENGEARFIEKSDGGIVYVDGRVCHRGRIEGKLVVYIDD